MPEGLCFFHPQGHLARPANPFGKDIANAALFRGLLNHGGFSEVAVLNQIGINPDQLQEALGLGKEVRLASAALNNTSWPARHGTLLRGQPYLSELSWHRRMAGLDRPTAWWVYPHNRATSGSAKNCRCSHCADAPLGCLGLYVASR